MRRGSGQGRWDGGVIKLCLVELSTSSQGWRPALLTPRTDGPRIGPNEQLIANDGFDTSFVPGFAIPSYLRHVFGRRTKITPLVETCQSPSAPVPTTPRCPILYRVNSPCKKEGWSTASDMSDKRRGGASCDAFFFMRRCSERYAFCVVLCFVRSSCLPVKPDLLARTPSRPTSCCREGSTG